MENVVGDFAGAVVVDIGEDPYTGDDYLDISYVNDKYGGGCVQDAGVWTTNNIMWVRIPCVEPIPNPLLSFSPAEIDDPAWTKPGIVLDTTVKLQNIVPPKGAVQDAFEDVNKAIQDRNRLINEGKEAYNKAIPRARGEALQIIQAAEGYAQEKVNLAKGDIARFLAVLGEYIKSPKVTRMRLYYEMFEEVFKKAGDTDLIDKNLKNFIPFKTIQDKKGGE